jgi:hypothetical protein|tara:strand:- start:272 stop:1372 length:1101 start_codon:yes stop_codon:yes gene_type:complete
MSQTKVEAPFVENNIPFRNVIINGDMVVNQRGSSSVTGLGGGGEHYFLDRIRNYSANTAGRYTISQETDVPAGLGFTNSVKFQCTTADTSVAATEITLLQQQIAGENLQRFNKGTSSAKQFTVSFYAKANESRVHALELIDTDNSNRHISKLFTVTTDWKRHVITFPADTTGTFDNDSNKSMSMVFWLHAGSNYTSGTLNSSAWGSLTDANRAVGIGSLMASTNNNFLLTGLQLEVGDKASEFEFLPHDVQLKRCQRYYYQMGPGVQYDPLMVGACNGSNNCYGMVHFPVEMRGDPSLTTTGTSADYCVYAGGHNPFPCDAGPTSNTIDKYGMRIYFTCTGDLVVAEAGEMLTYNNSAYLGFDAEI